LELGTAPGERGQTGLIGSVQRALRVLEVVAGAGDGVTAKVVARRSGYKLSTTYHLLNTLVHEGYLVRLPNARGFGLGYKLTGLHERLCSELDVVPSVFDALKEMHTAVRAPMYYTVFRDSQVVVAAVADSPQYPRAQPIDLGFHEAPHATAFGKVMLSSMPRASRRDFLAGGGLPKLTAETITTGAGLDDELTRVSRSGLAVEVEEFQPELACLGAPVVDGAGSLVGAVALSVPAVQFPERRAELERATRAGAARVSRLISAGAE
jgi:DNA-binding IclR family transcriptional regulator